MKYLLNTVESWRVDSETEALEMQEELSAASPYDLTGFTYDKKYDKKKDEEYYVVKVKKAINNVKDPTSNVVVGYGWTVKDEG